jgi:Na+/proline symporter
MNFGVFALISVIYFFYAVSKYKEIKSPNDFFHDKNMKKNIISLLVANITIGTGFAYLIQGGYQNGVLFLFAPVGVLLGYFGLRYFISKLPNECKNEKNLIENINYLIESQTGCKSNFKKTLTLSLSIVFCLLLAYEIFVSSQIMAAAIFKTTDVSLQISLSLIIGAIALLYTIIGGYRGVIRSDSLQFIFIIVCTVAIFYYVGEDRQISLTKNFISQIKINDLTIIVNCLMAFLFAFLTQFYSLINMGAISHYEEIDKQKNLLKTSGILTTLFLTIIVVMGITFPVSNNGNPDFVQFLASKNNNVFSILLICGFSSIVFSTIDTLILTITMFYYDNILKMNSKEVNSLNLKSIKIKVTSFFIIVLIILGLFNYIRPNIFYLLIGIGGGVSIFATMILSAGYLIIKNKRFNFTNTHVNIYFCLFVLAYLCNLIAFVTNNVFWASYNALAFLFVAIIFSFYIVSKRGQHGSQLN